VASRQVPGEHQSRESKSHLPGDERAETKRCQRGCGRREPVQRQRHEPRIGDLRLHRIAQHHHIVNRQCRVECADLGTNGSNDRVGTTRGGTDDELMDGTWALRGADVEIEPAAAQIAMLRVTDDPDRGSLPRSRRADRRVEKREAATRRRSRLRKRRWRTRLRRRDTRPRMRTCAACGAGHEERGALTPASSSLYSVPSTASRMPPGRRRASRWAPPTRPAPCRQAPSRGHSRGPCTRATSAGRCHSDHPS